VRRTIIAAGLFAWSLFTAAHAWAQSFVQLFVLRMAVGIGEASAGPASQSLISDSVPPENRARGLSVISIGAVAGLALGMAGGGWASEYFGWRAAFVIAGVPGLALAILFRFTVREPARGASERRAHEAGGSSGWLSDSRHLLSLPAFRWLLIAHACAIFFSIGKNSWEPTFLRRVYDMGPAAAGTWYFLITPLPSALGIFLGGWLSDRWGRRDVRARMWVPALTQLACIAPNWAFFVWPAGHVIALPAGLPDFPIAFAWSIVGSLIGGAYTAPMLSTAQDLAPPRMRATAAAILSLSAAATGSAFGPLVVGELNVLFAPQHGDEAVRWALVAILVVPALTTLFSLIGARRLGADLAQARAEAARSPA
jgi:MFS family permease